MFTCDLCGDSVEGLESVVDHMRVLHPDHYDPPKRWPDGALVIVDKTLTPGDFA